MVVFGPGKLWIASLSDSIHPQHEHERYCHDSGTRPGAGDRLEPKLPFAAPEQPHSIPSVGRGSVVRRSGPLCGAQDVIGTTSDRCSRDPCNSASAPDGTKALEDGED